MRALITYTGDIVNIENLVDPEFSFNGFLSTFWYKNKAVRYCHMDTVRERIAINDYYYWDAYSDYINNVITIDELVEKHKFTNFEYINSVQPNAQQINVFVDKLYLSGPNYEELFFTQRFKWDYIEGEEIFGYDNNFNPFIKLPQRAIDNAYEAFPQSNAIPVVQSFYNKNKYLIHSEEFSINPKEIARILNQICWTIQRICEDIFPLFNSDSVFNAYIIRQKQEWTDDEIMDEPDYALLVAYYDGLYDFYYSASLYKVNIQALKGKEKLHFLARILGSKALSIMPLEDRMNILKQMISKHLSSIFKVEIEEQIVIRIVRSFGYNEESDRNEFLTRLVNADFKGDGEAGKTMYEVFYERMSTAWEITRSTIELINWGFNATWKPTDTRGMFVKAIYCLWLRSKYNPYDFDTFELKPNTIGLKKKVSGTTWYQTNDIENSETPEFSTNKPNTLYFYTDHVGYKRLDDDSMGNPLFSSVDENAACITLNYNSFKNVGFYIDNHNFKFVSSDIRCDLTYSKYIEGMAVDASVFSGKYHIFQPIHLLSNSMETAEPILMTQGEMINFNGTNINSLVPIFFLKYIDDLGDSKDLQTFLGAAFDVVSTFIPVSNLAKLRHLRHLTWFGKVAVVIESVQITAGVVNFLLGFVDECNVEGTFCKKLRTFLFYLELSAIGTDAILVPKVKKSAKEVVEEGIENGWPSGMLDELDGTTPKQKIEELANTGILRYLDEYIDQAKGILKSKIDADLIHFVDYYSTSQLTELFTIASGKGLSIRDAAGIVHQACRKRSPVFIASISVLSQRMDNILIVRKRKFPFTFADKAEFDLYVENYIIPTISEFDLPTFELSYGGSSVTSTSSFSGGIQDTDWVTYWKNEEEIASFLEKQFEKYKLIAERTNKANPNKYAKTRISGMKNWYNKRGYFDKKTIIGTVDNQGNYITLDAKLKSFPDEFKTDLTPKLYGKNNTLPNVKY